MKIFPEKGYEVLWQLEMTTKTNPSPEEKAKHEATVKKLTQLETFHQPENMIVKDFQIPGLNGAPEITLRMYRMKDAGTTPLLIDIHGGGFVAGDLNKDNNRCAYYTLNVPCTTIQVGYRLAPGSVFPAQIEDCYAALLWAYDHADEIGIDKTKIALHGSSAGGSLVAGLALYSRDHGGPRICLQIMQYPTVDHGQLRPSAMHFFDKAPICSGSNYMEANKTYLGGYDGTLPSYYAVPALCPDLGGLPPAAIVTCEYDCLRDDGIAYASKLMAFGIPCELYSLPRIPHAFDLIDEPRTRWIREGLCLSLKREFDLQ